MSQMSKDNDSDEIRTAIANRLVHCERGGWPYAKSSGKEARPPLPDYFGN